MSFYSEPHDNPSRQEFYELDTYVIELEKRISDLEVHKSYLRDSMLSLIETLHQKNIIDADDKHDLSLDLDKI